MFPSGFAPERKVKPTNICVMPSLMRTCDPSDSVEFDFPAGGPVRLPAFHWMKGPVDGTTAKRELPLAIQPHVLQTGAATATPSSSTCIRTRAATVTLLES